MESILVRFFTLQGSGNLRQKKKKVRRGTLNETRQTKDGRGKEGEKEGSREGPQGVLFAKSRG